MSANQMGLKRLALVECHDSTCHEMELPLVLKSASGSWIWDADGHRYVDLCAGFGVMALGHNPSQLRELLSGYLADGAPIMHGMGDVYPSESKIALLETIRSILPPHLVRGSLALTGSQAVEIAIKSAILARQKMGFISFEGGYHGVDLGILPLTSRPDFSTPFSGRPAAIDVRRLPFGKADRAHFVAAVQDLELSGAGFCGVLVEPVQGRSGAIVPPEGWLASIVEWTHEYGGLAIFDEVFCGLGRCGHMTFAEETPADLVCLGKALGGGFPVSACFGTESVMSSWPVSRGEAIHTGTFFGHPLSCDIATQVLRTIVSEALPDRALRVGQEVRLRIATMFADSPQVAAITGLGMMIAIHFHEANAGARLMIEARKKGIIALASGNEGQALSMTPAFTIDKEMWLTAAAQIRALL